MIFLVWWRQARRRVPTRGLLLFIVICFISYASLLWSRGVLGDVEAYYSAEDVKHMKQYFGVSNSSNLTTISLDASSTPAAKSGEKEMKGDKSTRNPLPSVASLQEPCWRLNCPFPRKNHIILSHHGTDPAGWGDRMFLFHRLADLAGYLCANLYVPSASHLLGTKHNNGTRLSDDLKWSDFREFAFGYNQTIQDLPRDENKFVASLTTKLSNRSQLLSVTSSTAEGNWDKFLRLENFTQEQLDGGNLNSENHYFVWKIQTNTYHMDLFKSQNPYHQVHKRPLSFPSKLPGTGSDGCSYSTWFNGRRSEYVSKVVNGIFQMIKTSPQPLLPIKSSDKAVDNKGGNSSIIGVLHLRRGDTTGDCDTSPIKMKRYLECSFANSTDLGKITVLLSTDEQDPTYVHEILSIFNNKTGNSSFSHISIQWLDPMIWGLVESLVSKGELPPRMLNNYFVFVVSSEIQKEASFFLEQRRKSRCKECEPIREWIKK